MATDSAAQAFAAKLQTRPDCRCESGLTDAELRRAEDRFQVSMAPLWREVLSIVHPVELPEPPRGADGIRRWTRFPDWRLRDLPATQALIDGPIDGVLFDVEQNGLWWRAWGDEPDNVAERVSTARRELAKVPKLTPLWDHRYAASTDSSPVFSIVQADLYVPALTLSGFVQGDPEPEDAVPPEGYPIGDVPFWSLLHSYSQVGHLLEFRNLAIGGL